MKLEETILEDLRQNFVEQYSAIPPPDILWRWITENFELKSRPLQAGVIKNFADIIEERLKEAEEERKDVSMYTENLYYVGNKDGKIQILRELKEELSKIAL